MNNSYNSVSKMIPLQIRWEKIRVGIPKFYGSYILTLKVMFVNLGVHRIETINVNVKITRLSCDLKLKVKIFESLNIYLSFNRR